MRKILLLLFLIPYAVIGQTDSLLKFTSVETVEGATKSELFLKARSWVNESFRSSKAVIEIIDKENGEISGNGVVLAPFYMKQMGSKVKGFTYYNFSFSIYVKDGRYKYEFTAFRFEKNSRTSFGERYVTIDEDCPYKMSMYSEKNKNEMWRSLKEELTTVMNEFISSLKSAMAAKSLKTDF